MSDPIRDWAESGVLALTGRPDGPPVLPPGRAATRARELTSWIAAATAGSPYHVALDGAQLLSERAALTGRTRAGAVSVGGSCRLLETSDGWAAVSCARPDDPALFGALIGGEIDEADPWPAIADWLRGNTGAVLAERAGLLGLAAGPVSREPAPPTALPTPRCVEGLLVVDFSALWAGPLCAHLLGLAGARVVKVETPTRPDGARFGNADFYSLLHSGHSAVSLDPFTTGGRRAMAGLVEAADIVIEASRPRALEGFGVEAEAAARSGTTWISITAHGRGSERIGFGDDIAAGAGLVAADSDGSPMFVGDAIADPLTGLTAAVAAMSAPAIGTISDIAMSTVVSEQLTDELPGAVPGVAKPQPRYGRGRVAAHGEDTEKVLRGLGIEVP